MISMHSTHSRRLAFLLALMAVALVLISVDKVRTRLADGQQAAVLRAYAR